MIRASYSAPRIEVDGPRLAALLRRQERVIRRVAALLARLPSEHARGCQGGAVSPAWTTCALCHDLGAIRGGLSALALDARTLDRWRAVAARAARWDLAPGISPPVRGAIEIREADRYGLTPGQSRCLRAALVCMARWRMATTDRERRRARSLWARIRWWSALWGWGGGPNPPTGDPTAYAGRWVRESRRANGLPPRPEGNPWPPEWSALAFPDRVARGRRGE